MATSTHNVISCITIYSQNGIDEIKRRHPNIVVDVVDTDTKWVVKKGAGYTLHEIRDFLADKKHAHDVEYEDAA
jgi:hypothetical protein